MIFISHRGNLEGPNPDRENTIDSIENCLKNGFDVEVDIWFENDSFYLGHDKPNLKLNLDLFKNDRIWFHIKNIKSLEEISKYSPSNFFWHQSDKCTLTSSKKLWLYPNHYINSPDAIFVLPELSENKLECKKYKCYGICTDFIKFYYDKYNVI